MDFHTLSRRELQAFCKRNKIPANTTNAAMADALKALEIVEGIEEFMQQSSQSESAQSSIELLDSSEVTSPFVPPTTAGRSTRRRNVLKDDVETVASIMTTTRRTTRKTAAKVSNESHADAMETPAVVAQASRRKVQIASACLKMDSQLKECVEEEKKDALMTPAVVGAASRRSRAEDTEKKVYSTRRSVRLAVKNVQTLSGEKSEGSELSNTELFAKDCKDQEVNQKEGLNGCNELPGITGVDAIGNMEEDKEKSEVVSAENEDITMGEMELGSSCEEEKSVDFAVEVQPEEEIGEMELGSTREEEKSIDFAVEVQPEDEIGEMELGSTREEEKSIDFAVEVQPEEIGEMELGSTREEEKSIDFAVEVQPAEEICDNTEYPGEEDAVVPVNVNDEVQQSEGLVDVPTCETVVTVENSNEVDIENDAGSQDEAGDSKEAKVEVHPVVVSDDKIGDEEEGMSEEDQDKEGMAEEDQDLNATLGKLTLQQEADCVDLGIPEEPKQTGMETPHVEEAVASVKNSPSKQQCDGVPLHEASLETGNMYSASKPLMAGFSDNKQNVGSGTEVVIMEETIKPAKDCGESLRSYEGESLRKLTKMLKEKLQISNKSSKQGTEALPRTALKVLPENQMIEGNGK